MKTNTLSKLNPNANFDLEDGSPTLTFVTSEESLAIPYHTLRRMTFAKNARSIQFTFDEFEVTVEGALLLPLWKELQIYNVREMRLAQGAADQAVAVERDDTTIRSIAIKALSNEDDPQDDIEQRD
jgi:hypothetical protein